MAHDGLSGLEAFEKLRPDLVLIEPMVPKKHGFEVCQEIKGSAHGQGTPVLITTGFYRGRKHHLEAKQYYGCDEYLEKPVSEEDLLATCRRLLPEIPDDAEPFEAVESLRSDITSDPELPELQDLSEEEIVARLDAMICEEPRQEPEPEIAAEPARPTQEPRESQESEEPEVVFESGAEPEPVQPPVEIITAKPESAPTPDEAVATGPRKRLLFVGLPAAALIVVAATGFVLIRTLGDREAAVAPAPARIDEIASLVTQPSPPALSDAMLMGPPAPAELGLGLTAADADPSVPPAGTDTRPTVTERPSAQPVRGSEPAVVKPPPPQKSATRTRTRPTEKPAPAPATRKAAPAPVVAETRATSGPAVEPAAPPTTKSAAQQNAKDAGSLALAAPQPRSEIPADATPSSLSGAPEVEAATGPVPGDPIASGSPDAAASGSLLAEPAGSSDSMPSSTETPLDGSSVVMPAPTPPRPVTPRGALVDLSDVDSGPTPQNKRSPEYPVAAQRMRLVGAVTLRLLIDEEGRVAETEVMPGSAGGVLAKSAVRAAQGWTYSPAMKDGVPVKVWVIERVSFQR